MRAPLLTELLTPAAALLLVVAAAVSRQPATFLGLPLLWFAPAAARALMRRSLDEREAAAVRAAETVALRALLVGAASLPWLLSAGGAATLQRESSDLGFLLLIVFVIRALAIARTTLPTVVAAHMAGACAVAVAATLVLGRFSPVPVVLAGLLALTLVPHGVAVRWPMPAAVLWCAGGLAATAYGLGGGFAPLEAILLAALLAGPWLVAGAWAARVGRGPVDA